MTLEADVQQGWHDAIVELFDLDLTPITGDVDDKFYFTNQLKPDDNKIVWQGRTYEPLPILATGYEKNTTGQIAQPSLTVANVMGTFTQVIDSLDDLVGAKVTRRRTLGKYLDGEPSADPLQEFPLDVFYIERKTSENALTITWQLGSVLDLEGLQLPRRVITQNYCQWKYRSSECGYTGSPLFNVNDGRLSTDGQSAEAVAVLNAYSLVLQRENELRVAINLRNLRSQEKEAACTTIVKLEEKFNTPTALGPDSYVLITSVSTLRFGGTNGITAVWNGASVTLGSEYRLGKNEGKAPGTNKSYYSIERWGVDATACSNATAALAAAEAALTIALNNYSSAKSDLASATSALPASDLLWQQDICGKRVNSCRLRFPTTPIEAPSLPFGGFPGANLTR